MTVKERGYAMTGRTSSSPHADARGAAKRTVQGREPVQMSVDFSKTTVSEIFGQNVFNRSVMRKLLPKHVYKARDT